MDLPRVFSIVGLTDKCVAGIRVCFHSPLAGTNVDFVFSKDINKGLILSADYADYTDKRNQPGPWKSANEVLAGRFD